MFEKWDADGGKNRAQSLLLKPRTNLTLESEGSADLVGGLVQVLGVEGGAEAEGDAGSELDVVC